jgi:hypothetical protein
MAREPSERLNNQTIFRRAKDRQNPYVMIDRTIFEVETLSYKAKGLMGYLLSRPDDWTVRMTDLIRRSTDGEHAVRTAVQELEEHGYMVRMRGRDPDTGQFGPVTIEVHEVPVPPDDRSAGLGRSRLRPTSPADSRPPPPVGENRPTPVGENRPTPVGENRPLEPPVGGFPQVGKPQVGKPQVGKPQVEKPALLSTDLPSTEGPSTDHTDLEPDADAPGPAPPATAAPIDPPSSGPDPPPLPASWPEWEDALFSGRNPIALIRAMIEQLYPNQEPPSYGHIGATAKRMGSGRNGQRRLMALIWEHSTRPPSGDLLPYLLRVHQGKVRDHEHEDHTSKEARRRYASDYTVPIGGDP